MIILKCFYFIFRTMNVVQTIFFIYFFPFGLSVLQEMITWKKIRFSENDLVDKVSLSNKHLSKNLFCSTSCSSITNCRFWCVKSDGFCYFYNLLVSPGYVTTENNTIDCYTEKRNDIIPQASIVSVGSYGSDTPEDLIDGIKGKRYCTSQKSKPWILINLKKSALIYDVIIHALTSSIYGPAYCSNLEVRISSTAPVTPGDFSLWDWFYYFDRECVAGGIEHLKPSNPQIGQYLSIKKNNGGLMCFLHLEIDGVFIN